MKKPILLIIAAASVVSGCNLAPGYLQPAPLIPESFPTGPAYSPASGEALRSSWRALLNEPRLETLVERAVADNRDFRGRLAQVQGARALYRGQRAAALPGLGASLSSSLGGGDAESHQASLSLTSFEIDLFGRLRNETASAFEAYLASEAGARAAYVTLVAETASAWLVLAADQDFLRLAEDTAASAQRAVELTQALNDRGLISRLDVVSAQQVLEQARADVADYTRQVAQDRNALELLVGGPISDELLPPSLRDLDAAVGLPSAGLSSAVLLDRPDVLQAEHQLRAAHADIGVARAALFPSISLTAAIGLISPSLGSLFSDGEETWSVSPSATAPIFAPGGRANVDYAQAQREVAVAAYQFAIQNAFRETADALARAGTIDDQRRAQDAQAAAAAESLTLSEARYHAGIDDYLSTLTAQRNAYGAAQGSLAVLLEDVLNRVDLYQAIGGSSDDWDIVAAGPPSASR